MIKTGFCKRFDLAGPRTRGSMILLLRFVPKGVKPEKRTWLTRFVASCSVRSPFPSTREFMKRTSIPSSSKREAAKATRETINLSCEAKAGKSASRIRHRKRDRQSSWGTVLTSSIRDPPSSNAIEPESVRGAGVSSRYETQPTESNRRTVTVEHNVEESQLGEVHSDLQTQAR